MTAAADAWSAFSASRAAGSVLACVAAVSLTGCAQWIPERATDAEVVRTETAFNTAVAPLLADGTLAREVTFSDA